MFDLIVIGGGVAGMTASLYALRNNKKVLLLEKETIGGQIAESPKVENYPTKKSVSGAELADEIFEQISDLGAEFEIEDVTKVEKKGKKFVVTTAYNTYEAKSVIIATGVKHRHLGLENEDKFLGKGIYYCALCDGPFFKGQPVMVIGGGNSAMQYALLLAGICSKVKVVVPHDDFTGEKSLIDAVKKQNNVEIITNARPAALRGEESLVSVVFKREDQSTFEEKANAVFIAVGQVPDNKIFAGLVDLDEKGYIIANESCQTKTDGLFVAGDCRTKDIRQVATAIGDGAVAGTRACNYLTTIED